MTTSGTVVFLSNRDTVIKGALRKVGGYDPENAAGPTATQISLAAETLNQLVKAWEAIGLQIWERKYGVVFPQKSQGIFVLGSPGPAGDHSCLSTPMGSGFVQTTLSASASSGASTITVTSTSSGLSTVGITAAAITNTYNIGVQLDSGTIQWTTVNGVPSGTTVTLAATLTGAATSGNYVFCYQTKLIRPLRILDAFVLQMSGAGTGYPTEGGNKVPVRIISKEEYNRFGNNTAAGTPTQLTYDAQANAGHVYVYPKFLNVTQLLYIEFTKPIDDFSSSSDDYDLPQEWELALVFNLALMLATEYEVPREKYKQIQEMANTTFGLVKGYDQENASVFLQPSDWMYQTPGR